MPPFNIPGSYRQLYLNRLEQAMNYIEKNLSAPLDLEKVAQAAGFSPYHFHRIFSALMGENPQDYILRQRLERAANLLVKNPTRSITEISFTCGFSSSSAFARAFKKHFGQPASSYARQGAPAARLETQVPATEKNQQKTVDVQVKQMETLHLVYFASRHGYSPTSTQAAWVKLFQWMNAHQLLRPETRLIGISFDDPAITPLNRCRYYACMDVPAEINNDPHASFWDFPAHLCAVTRFRCRDVAEIQETYRLIYRTWLPDSGFFMADLPPYEIIYEAPDVNPGGDYVFDLCVPITVF
ncbi:MAG: AraC family transcriptional regulator [Anaerolineae bacterium]|nr:AraC family transcriptional regulator [Anaerolineae bacterium]